MLLDKRTEKLQKQFPNDNIDELSLVVANGRFQVNRQQLMMVLDVSDTMLVKYEQMGMPRSDFTKSNYVLYDLTEAISWYIANIDIKKSKKSKDIQVIDEELENDWTYRKARADALKTEQQALAEELKVKELKKELVRKEDTDKAMADLASTMGAMYRNDLKALPVLLENKQHIDIKKELDRHYKDRMEDMHKILSVEIAEDCEETEYAFDVLYETIRKKNDKN